MASSKPGQSLIAEANAPAILRLAEACASSSATSSSLLSVVIGRKCSPLGFRPLLAACRPIVVFANDLKRTVRCHSTMPRHARKRKLMTRAVPEAARSPIAFAHHEIPPKRKPRYNKQIHSNPDPTAKIAAAHFRLPAVMNSGKSSNAIGRVAKKTKWVSRYRCRPGKHEFPVQVIRRQIQVFISVLGWAGRRQLVSKFRF